jgi:hypothetical protein
LVLDVLAEFGRIPAGNSFFLTKGVPLISFSGSQMPRKVHLVPWALPPGMIYIKKVTKYDGWCGKMDPGCTARCVWVGS